MLSSGNVCLKVSLRDPLYRGIGPAPCLGANYRLVEGEGEGGEGIRIE